MEELVDIACTKMEGEKNALDLSSHTAKIGLEMLTEIYGIKNAEDYL